MKRILVPLDFSRYTNSAIRYSILFARQMQASLIFFHASTSLILTGISRAAYKNAVEKEIASETRRLRKKVREAFKFLDLPLETVETSYVSTMDGTIPSIIIKSIEEKDIDLVIMPTRGATGLRKLITGSRTSRVISKTRIPILAIPFSFKFVPVREIVYASDLKDFEHEFQIVRQIAENLQARIKVLHLTYGIGEISDSTAMIKKYKLQGVEYIERTIKIENPLIDNLKQFMKSEQGSILCMFDSFRSGLERLYLGSKTEDLSMDLKFPLLAIRKP